MNFNIENQTLHILTDRQIDMNACMYINSDLYFGEFDSTI